MRIDRKIGSFQINTRTGEWRDYATGEGGSDAASLYAYLYTGGHYRAALQALANDPLVKAGIASGVTAGVAIVASPLEAAAGKVEYARRLYAAAVGLAGMPAEAYLRSRGLRPTPAWDGLRASILPYRGQGRHPVLIAPVAGSDGSLVGVHRTYLTAAGAKLGVPEPKLTLGQVRGGAIRLGEPTAELTICEGLEDGLTLTQVLGVPVWVSGGASFLHLMEIPDTVRVLTIGADNDAAGERAAQRAAGALGVGGRKTRILRPAPGFKDFNSELQVIKS